jgi:hypothetical protein
MSAARPLRRRSASQAALAQACARPLAGAGHAAGHDATSGSRPLGGRSVDLSSCLRTSECLATRPRLQARPWDARSAKGAT